ncbi:MAG TPA: hypothetical protein VHZ76_00880 [Gammaproteobacteria bacterium]|nr:hypothetical protein [Gammaproteobacteria bacterium]
MSAEQTPGPFDYSNRFEEVGFTRDQAETLVTSITKMTKTHVATQEDLKTLETGLKHEINLVRHEINIVGNDIKASEEKLSHKIKTSENSLRAEFKHEINRILFWIPAVLLGQAAFIVSCIKFIH